MAEIVELTVEVELLHADADELERVGQQLRAEILELDVRSVEPVPGGPAPAGSKMVDWNLLGAWVVQLGVASVPGLFGLLKDRQQHAPASAPLKIKVTAGRHRQVEIEYDPARTTPEQLADLVQRLQQALRK